jgi:hypothetical protein
VYLPLSISSLCALIRKRAGVDRFDNSFILSKHFSCWNINLNLQYVRNLLSFLVSCIYYILKELDMLKMFKSPFICSAREINIIRKKLREIYKNLEGED